MLGQGLRVSRLHADPARRARSCATCAGGRTSKASAKGPRRFRPARIRPSARRTHDPPAAAFEAASGTPSAASPPAAAYATYRNPFAYFQSLTDSGACARSETGISQLKADLAQPARTASLSYIVPGLCHDGGPTRCAPGAPAGPAAADSFLHRVVPEILASGAYKQNGLLVITGDEAPSSGEFEDSSSCCGQPAFPNLGAAGLTPTGRPRGGGAVGALLLSPFIKEPASSAEEYSHFSLLATIEDLFAVKRLGYAGLSAVVPLAPSIFTASG